MTTATLHSPILTARNLRISCPKGEAAGQLNFDLKPSEITTLIGGTPSARRRFLRTLLGLDTLEEGQVWKSLEIVTAYAPLHLAQDPLLPMSAGRFVRLGTDAPAKDAADALEFVGLMGEAQTPLSDLPTEALQKVSLARALVRGADLLILEEPGALGLDARADFFALITRLKERLGCGILMASHDLNIVMAQCDRVLCIEEGEPCQGAPIQAVAAHAFRTILGRNRAEQFAIYRHKTLHEDVESPEPVLIPAIESIAS